MRSSKTTGGRFSARAMSSPRSWSPRLESLERAPRRSSTSWLGRRPCMMPLDWESPGDWARQMKTTIACRVQRGNAQLVVDAYHRLTGRFWEGVGRPVGGWRWERQATKASAEAKTLPRRRGHLLALGRSGEARGWLEMGALGATTSAEAKTLPRRRGHPLGLSSCPCDRVLL